MSAQSTLELLGAEVRLGGRAIWSELSLRVAPGEFVAVLGPNGAGKTTLLEAMLGEQALSQGWGEVLGGPLGSARTEIGYLPQRRHFDPHTRVRGIDLVRLGLDGTRWGLPLPLGRRGGELVARAVRDVGASSFAERPIGRLSGGEQQRLLIAQALVAQPRMLVLDEPLDSLDLPSQGAIACLLHGLCATSAVSVVLVAHDVNPMLGLLDRVVYLAGGKAIVGAPREVITTANLTRLYGSPVEVLESSDGRLVVVGQPEAPALHHPRHDL
ncbi:MAG: metal ABC transporter ATP-binding protein [Solirubrobacteraceae bacterium]